MRFTKEMIAGALAGKPDDSKLIGDAVRRCARAGSAKARAADHADDVEQELWIFLMRNSDRLNEEYNLEPYLIQTARNIALSHARKFNSYGTDGEDTRGDESVGIDGGFLDPSGNSGFDALLDRQAAMDAIKRKHPGIGKPTTINRTPKDRTVMKNDRPKLSHDQEELRSLRMSLGLTQTLMSARLGLKLPTYQAYEYGRTKGVPKKVMVEAKKLQADPEYSSTENKYKGMTMREIAQSWSKRIGLGPNNPQKLAMALGINKSSTSRWLNGDSDVKLTTTELVIYERRVELEEAYRKKRSASSEGA